MVRSSPSAPCLLLLEPGWPFLAFQWCFEAKSRRVSRFSTVWK